MNIFHIKILNNVLWGLHYVCYLNIDIHDNFLKR